MPVETPAFQLDSDGTARREDKYSRAELAERVAEALVRAEPDESLVLALEGPWGSGKSWLIEQVTEALRAGRAGGQAKVVHFNPWLIGEESNLILDFLVQIGLEIDATAGTLKSAKTAAASLLGYAKALSYGRYLKYMPVPGLKEVGEFVDEQWEQHAKELESASEKLEGDSKHRPSLTEARKAARAAVGGLEQRLVVVIDDIDRLRAREIRAVMQLVKAVADFPKTSFLLSMDAEAVARALAEGSDATHGARYLEKIVQLGITLPPTDLAESLRDVRARFDRLSGALAHQIKPYELRLLDEALYAVARLCRSPRDVVRWANHLGWSARGLAGSINLADLCVAEALQLRLGAQLWQELLSSQGADREDGDGIPGADYWLQPDLHRGVNRRDEQARIAALPAVQPCLAALRWLFPDFAAEAPGSGDKFLEHCRLAVLPNLQHYRRFRANRNDVSGRDLDNWLANPSEFDQALGNDEPQFTRTHLERLEAVGKRLDFEHMPHTLKHLLPLLRALKRHAGSKFGQAGVPAPAMVQMACELLLALHRGSQAELLQAADSLELPEAVAALELLKTLGQESAYQAADKRRAAMALSELLQARVVGRLEHAVADRSLLGMRANLYMLHALHRIDSLTAAARAVDRLTGTPHDLAVLLAPVAELPSDYWRMASIPLIDLVPDPEEFVQSIMALDDGVFATLKAACGYQFPKQRLDELARQFLSTTSMEELIPRKASTHGSGAR